MQTLVLQSQAEDQIKLPQSNLLLIIQLNFVLHKTIWVVLRWGHMGAQGFFKSKVNFETFMNWVTYSSLH